MSTIRDLILNHRVHTVPASESVTAAAIYMTQCNVGALPVLDGDRFVGVFSERDVLTRVVAARRNPETTRVHEVMTSDPFVVGPDDSLERCMVTMKQQGFRHLPVCDGDQLIGFLSMRDLLLHDLDEKEIDLKMIRDYVQAS